jgi:hypothetical protein
VLVHDVQGSLADPVAERHHPSHPDALLLGGGDLVPDALARDLALELGKGQSTLRVSRPMLEVVLKAWVTETNDTPC